LVLALLPTQVALARIGLAEGSWRFQHDSTNLVEWDHGDVCGDAAPRADCFFYVPIASPGQRSPAEYTIPVKIGIGSFGFYADAGTDAPNLLLWGLAGPLAVISVIVLSVRRLWRAARVISNDDLGGSRLKSGLWIIVVLAALTQLGWAAGVLLPIPLLAAPTLQLLYVAVNIWIVVSPWVLWHYVANVRARHPQDRLARLARVGMIGLSGSFASFLGTHDPPTVLEFIFPPLLVVNLGISLVAVYAARAARDLLVSRLKNSSSH
jgi:hypothetical protein